MTHGASLTGRILGGRFQVGERLHLGGSVEVYAANDLRGGEDVAVKVLARLLARDSELRARLATEAQAAGVLQHPNVVRVIDYGEDGDVAYIVMERLRGVTLRQMLDAQGPLAVDDACTVARAVLSSLDAAHRLGIRHRDLKPSNVFVSRDADGALQAKLMDFGVAKIEGGIRSSMAAVGTPRYFPPERIQNPGIEDHRGDLHAAGVVFYEALSGQHPFRAVTLEEQMARTLGSEAPSVRTLRADVPEGVAQVIARALARDPKDRFSSAAEMSEELEKAYSQTQ